LESNEKEVSLGERERKTTMRRVRRRLPRWKEESAMRSVRVAKEGVKAC
jgi:hypothetical protein